MTMVGEKLAGSNYGLLDFVAIGVNKRVAEAILQPVIGNGTIKSGVIKGAGGFVLEYVRPKGSDLIAKEAEWMEAGLIIDAVDDVTLAILGPNPLGSLLGTSTQSTSQGVIFI